MTRHTEPLTKAEETVSLPRNVSIVIVEDDRGHYLLTKHCLREGGVSNNIIWLEDGGAAMDFFFNNGQIPPQQKYLVLLDIRLPKVDGTVILEKMKQDESLSSIPVIMLTTSEDRQVANHCYELGCEAHVIKPPGPVLLKAIERIRRRL